ncbi:MATE family efflux transporter [Stomatobaculum longum]|jgi:MATE efflux family protein|uniref:MATE family efflux transporter n=1 Tax=Stomatobaculum longum TaxID=796942 RepID=UPI0028E94C80|nr:MATE family efflux transporter [Stomatobaculum longum]
MREISQEARYRQMMEEPVHTLIPRLAVPSIISMLVTAIYNMADTYFVSQLGTSPSAAVGVVFSLMAGIQAVAFMIGMGCGNEISRLLGQKEREEAERYVATGFFTELIAGTLIAIAGILFSEKLVYLLGSTATIAPYAASYTRYVLIGIPFFMASLGMNNMLRFQGNSFYSMIGIATGGILNMFLDPLLIYGFHMGIAGAAVATSVSQMISFCILVWQCNCMPACLSIRLRRFAPSLERYRNILRFGLPSLARQGIASISVIVINFAAQPYGDAAIAAIAIVSRVAMFMNSAIIGFGQGFQPVCGFNYGAGNYKRVEQAYNFSLRVCFAALLLMGALVFFNAERVIVLFRKDPDVIAVGTLALQLQSLSIPLAAQITMANMFSQTTGYNVRATVVALLRQGICLIPILLVLPRLFGVRGIQAAQPLSDVFAAVIAFFITRSILREMRRKTAEQERQ